MVVFGATPKLTLKAKTTVTDEMMAIQCFSSWLMQLVRGGTCAGRLSGKALARTCGLELFSRLIRDFDQPALSTPSAPFAVHPFYVCTRLIVQLHVHAHTCSHCSTMDSYAPPASPPAVTVIAHLLHSVRIKTTKPLFRCSSDIRVNLGKCTAT